MLLAWRVAQHLSCACTNTRELQAYAVRCEAILSFKRTYQAAAAAGYVNRAIIAVQLMAYRWLFMPKGTQCQRPVEDLPVLLHVVLFPGRSTS